jgi:hypothetical protein
MDDRFQYYDDILRSLAASLAKQDLINDDLRECVRQQRAANERQEITNLELREFNREQVEISRDVKTTLARIETLLARMIARSDNGTEA